MRAFIRITVTILFVMLGLQTLPAAAAQCAISDNETVISTTSNNDYDSNCPCPYSFDKKGNHCGGRSAWSKSGGKTPACYPLNDAYLNTPFSLPAKPASCPCPYNYDENGVRCGARSAWSRSGGITPACYTSSDFLNEGPLLNTTLTYTNKCQCPYDTDENGERCGDKSEWTRTRGAVANCYPQNN